MHSCFLRWFLIVLYCLVKQTNKFFVAVYARQQSTNSLLVRLPVYKSDTMKGKLHVHNPDAYVECMQAADWSEPQTKHLPQISVGKAPKGTKQREAFLEKQSVREQQFRMKLEVAKQAAERRQREKTEQREKDFEKRFLEFVELNQSLVKEVDGAVRADEAWRIRKRERLFNEWTLKVFQPMQDEINRKLASQSNEEIEQKRRYMFQCFLDESNRKTNGLFRDIIIDSDYDPITQAKQATMVYTRAKITEDPTKNRATREAGDSLVRGLLPPVADDQERRTFVSVEMWNRMEDTPYGRYSSQDDNPDKRPRKPNFLRSNVTFNHFDIATGVDAVKTEQQIRGKGKTPSAIAQQSHVAECFSMYDGK
jgi:hypothetical protein